LAFIISRHRQGASVIVTHPHCHHLPRIRNRAAGTVVDYKQRSPILSSGIEAAHRSIAVIMGAPAAPSLLRRHDGCLSPTADV
jgi:hypothetical protein